MPVTLPTETHCPQISNIDDIVAPQYDVPGATTGEIMTFAKDGCIPSKYAEDYNKNQLALSRSAPGSAEESLLKMSLAMQEVWFAPYQFRLSLQTVWVKALDIIVPANTQTPPTTVATSIGSSNSEAYTFGLELGVRVWAEAEGGVIFAKAKAGMELSAKVSMDLNRTYTWSSVTETTVAAPVFTATQDTRVIVWQQVSTVGFQERIGILFAPSPDEPFTTTSEFVDRSTTFQTQVFPPQPPGAIEIPTLVAGYSALPDASVQALVSRIRAAHADHISGG